MECKLELGQGLDCMQEVPQAVSQQGRDLHSNGLKLLSLSKFLVYKMHCKFKKCLILSYPVQGNKVVAVGTVAAAVVAVVDTAVGDTVAGDTVVEGTVVVVAESPPAAVHWLL